MANVINMNAEAGANYIGDDAEPAMQFQVLGSTGPGLKTFGFVSVSGATVGDLNARGTLSTNPAGIFSQVVGNVSIGILRIVGNSVASGAALEFSNKAFISITSTVLTTVANTDYAIRVQVGLETRWIPLFKDAAMIGSAAF